MPAAPPPGELLVPVRAVRESVEHFFPIVFWAPPSASVPVMTLVPPVRGTLLDDLPPIIAELLSVLGPPAWFAVAFDSYATNDDSVAAGSLEEAFLGGHPSVVEQIVLAVVSADSLDSYRQVYRCTPVDGWEWDDVEASPSADRMLLAGLSVVPLHRG